jgi:hypothetical protein
MIAVLVYVCEKIRAQVKGREGEHEARRLACAYRAQLLYA